MKISMSNFEKNWLIVNLWNERNDDFLLQLIYDDDDDLSKVSKLTTKTNVNNWYNNDVFVCLLTNW